MILILPCPDCNGADPVCLTCDGTGKIIIGRVTKDYSNVIKWTVITILFAIAVGLWIVNLR